MESIHSLDELKRLCEEVKQQKDRAVGVQIIVGMGSCGIAVGAGETTKTILHMVESENISGVTVKQVGCIGLCEYEPVVQVVFGNQPVTLYHNVNRQIVERIIKQHVLKGEPVTEYILDVYPPFIGRELLTDNMMEV